MRTKLVEEIRRKHQKCCLTNSFQDHGCKIDIRGLDLSRQATFHGSKHQKHHGTTGKLCDRLIFLGETQILVCSIELKGGKNVNVSDAIMQIQGGLDLAKTMSSKRSGWNWYPLLAYSGSMSGKGKQLLRARPVSFDGKKKLIDRVDCGFSLAKYLSAALP